MNTFNQSIGTGIIGLGMLVSLAWYVGVIVMLFKICRKVRHLRG